MKINKMINKLRRYYEKKLIELPDNQQIFVEKVRIGIEKIGNFIVQLLVSLMIISVFNKLKNELGYETMMYNILVIILIMLRANIKKK